MTLNCRNDLRICPWLGWLLRGFVQFAGPLLLETGLHRAIGNLWGLDFETTF
jgi:hypothetical protein